MAEPGESASAPIYSLRAASFAEALLDAEAEIPPGIGKGDRQAPKRFAVYRNNVVVSLMEALKAAYPSLLAIMGEANFDKIARIYVARHPPLSPLMQDYGADFADFLGRFNALRRSPFLADIAAAERLWLTAYHATDRPPLAAEALAAIAPEVTPSLTLEPHPATGLLASDFPIADLFDARHHWPVEGLNMQSSQAILITRPGFEVMVTRMNAPEAVFARALIEQVPLGEAIASATAAADAGEMAYEPAASIGLVLRAGAFCGLTRP